jgi:hypothetical protein
MDAHGPLQYFRTVTFAYLHQCETVVMASAGKKWLAALLEEGWILNATTVMVIRRTVLF